MGSSKRDQGIKWLIFLILIYWVLSMLIAGKIYASEARTIRITEKQMGVIRTQIGRSTIVSFSTKPSKVILGSKGTFVVEYVENDIAVAPAYAGAKSNLFVYVGGRRFAFDLISVAKGADQIVLVRDPFEQEIKVPCK